ncbi:MAG: class F sortase [Streptomycetaceae bacterium]|nr:class F sortase [Streptomycetaceae bacterium]
MKTANLLIGAGIWLTVGAIVGWLSNYPIPPPADPVAVAGDNVPITLKIPSRHVTAPVEPVSTGERGSLNLPAASQVGWWIGGSGPLDPHGTVVLAGHVDSRLGPGVLRAVGNLRHGERIEVATAHGTTTYVVSAVSRYPKQSLPRSLFTTQGPRRLALVTCGGPFDQATGHYRDNVVAVAEPV